MVEERLGNLGVELRADVDEHGIRPEAGEPQHRHQERRLVAADAVAVVEGDVDVMRRIARRRVFHGKAHVPDLLGNELEDAPDGLVFRLASQVLRQLPHLRDQRGVSLREMRRAEIPVPLRDLGPALGRRDAHVLHLRVEGRHLRLGKRLRRVGDGERVHDGPVVERTFRRDNVAERMANRLLSDRQRRRRPDLEGRADDRTRPFHHRDVGPLALRPRLEHLAVRLHVDGFADLEAGDAADDLAVEGVVDVRRHRGVVGLLLHRLRHVDLPLDAVRADCADIGDLAEAVALQIVERSRALVAPALLGEDLRPRLVPGLVRAVRVVCDPLDLVHKNGIRIGKPLRRHVVVAPANKCRHDCQHEPNAFHHALSVVLFMLMRLEIAP